MGTSMTVIGDSEGVRWSSNGLTTQRACFVVPDNQYQGSSFVFLDHPFEIVCLYSCVLSRFQRVLIPHNKVKKRLKVSL